MKNEDIDFIEEVAKAASEEKEIPKPPVDNSNQSQATVIVSLFSDAETWHTPDKEPYIGIPVDNHVENIHLTEHSISYYIKQAYYQKFNKVPQDKAVKDAIGVLQGKALFESPEKPVYIRMASHDGNVYIDLANEQWQVVKIDSSGWQIVDDAPVKFRRPRGMLALPTPEHGGSIEELRPFLNVNNNNDFILTVGWLVAACNPQGPYIALAQHGEQGSAKSTNSRVFRSLIDPNKAPLRSAPRDTHDLVIAAENSWIVAFDNLSYIKNDLSDDLCRLATGGSFSTRRLYTGRDEELFDAQRPVLFNGIEEVANRSDLIDRLIILYLPTIPAHERLDEKRFWTDFKTVQARIQGTLYDAVSTALRDINTVKLKNLPRMADVAKWVSAAQPAFGWETETFVNAYSVNRREINHLALESSIISPYVREILNKYSGAWEGTATDLKDDLEYFASEDTRRDRRWPKDAKSLSGKLRRIAPNLRAVGIEVTFWRTNDEERTRMVTLHDNNITRKVPSYPDQSENHKHVVEENTLQNDQDDFLKLIEGNNSIGGDNNE